MDSKLIEAAAEALLNHNDGYCLGEHSVPERAALNLARAAILAFLDAAAGDEGTVEKVAESVADAMNMNRVGRLEIDATRAALSALKGEVKP